MTNNFTVYGDLAGRLRLLSENCHVVFKQLCSQEWTITRWPSLQKCTVNIHDLAPSYFLKFTYVPSIELINLIFTVRWCIWKQGTYTSRLRVKGNLKYANYVWNCRRCFLLGLLFNCFLGEHTYNPLLGGYTPPVLFHHSFAVRKCQITQSQAFETKYYGHPDNDLYYSYKLQITYIDQPTQWIIYKCISSKHFHLF